MSKETKFGYGFLLAGVGLPYLIEKLSGPTLALIVASAFLLIGVSLLIAGHLHEKSGLATKVIVAFIAFSLLAGGIAWRIVGGRTESATA